MGSRKSSDLVGRPAFEIVAYNLAAVDPDPQAAVARVRPHLGWAGDPAWAAHLDPLPLSNRAVAWASRLRPRRALSSGSPVEHLSRRLASAAS